MSTPTAQVTGDVIVRQCTVTVVRRGGWSWGPDPRGLVHRVVAVLPDLLAEHLAARLAGDGPDVEITEPVTVTLRARSLLTTPAPADVEVSVEPGPIAPDPSGPSEVDELASSLEESFAAESEWAPLSVAGFFAELAERGDLDPLLALLPEETARLYARAVLDAFRADPSAFESAALPRLLAAPEPPVHEQSAVKATLLASDARKVALTAEVRVCSALPFLLAGPLARTGYLDAIGPALGGIDLLDDAPLFAAALAYKVLGVVERGWRRTEGAREAAAAFAGLEAPVPEDALTAFSRHVRPALPVLDGVLALSLSRGHEAAVPLLITGAAGGLLLVDTEGLFPVAWAAEPAGLLPHWQACGRPPVLICDSPLPPGCLAALASAGMRFVTDVRPVRGDPLVRLPWRSPLWTVEGAAPDRRLAAGFAGHAARVGELIKALVAERVAVPRADEPDLERSVTLAASLGLGIIAWELWHEREVPSPTLALARFADLDASVRFERDAVRVRVPLGRRHTDLLRAGLLSDVPRVVWLGGRTLTFSGG